MRAINKIVIHCSASRTSATADDIISYHLTPKANRKTGAKAPYIKGVQGGLGWNTGGYHYVIESNGNVVNTYPPDVVTNGVKGHNKNSLHICLIGGRAGVSDFSANQFEALEDLLYSLTESLGSVVVLGHRDLSPDLDGDGIVEPHEWLKLCPAFDVAQWLRKIKFRA